MIMAGGTGGHVFPALAVADWLREQGCRICWLGTPHGMELRLAHDHGYPVETIQVSGLRGTGILGALRAPFVLVKALWQSWRVLRRIRPDLVLGMGGFVTGPGGVMARLLKIPLVIQEQNAIPGMTNYLLSRFATRVFEAFPGSFPDLHRVEESGNPVRREIVELAGPEERFANRDGRLRLLVVGGSLGAKALNEVVPAALAMIPAEERPLVRHQTGEKTYEVAVTAYAEADVEAELTTFLTDMAEAYAWADLVICRAGALTISELAAAGLGAVLVPFPYAVDDHQTHNGNYLVNAGAALLVQQKALDARDLSRIISEMSQDRARLLTMAKAARALARPDAARRVGEACLQELRR